MTPGQKKSIEAIATQLLKNANVDLKLPIDIEKVASSIDLRVEYFPFPDEISGLLKSDVGIIGVNKNQNPRRQRFTLAHEIGHYVLGHRLNSSKDLIDDATTDASNPIEREANYFASALLMPVELVRKHSGANLNIPHLANIFNVSEQALTIRLLELALVK